MSLPDRRPPTGACARLESHLTGKASPLAASPDAKLLKARAPPRFDPKAGGPSGLVRAKAASAPVVSLASAAASSERIPGRPLGELEIVEVHSQTPPQSGADGNHDDAFRAHGGEAQTADKIG